MNPKMVQKWSEIVLKMDSKWTRDLGLWMTH